MDELNRMPIDGQMELIGALANLRVEQFYGVADNGRFGQVQRGSRLFYRVRIGDMRFYLQFVDDGIFCNYILPRHSFEDFCFRCGFSSFDDSELDESCALWQFLEDGSGDGMAERGDDETTVSDGRK
jgi:mRNA interferase RelE/StbE